MAFVVTYGGQLVLNHIIPFVVYIRMSLSLHIKTLFKSINNEKLLESNMITINRFFDSFQNE